MSMTIPRVLVAAAIAALSLPVASSSAAAQSDWRFQATIYGFMSSISGTTAFPGENGGREVTIDFGTILDNLNFTLQGMFEMSRGDWGAFTDLVYMSVGKQASGTRDFELDGSDLPANVAADVDVEVKNAALAIAGTYRIVDSPGTSVQLLAGTRLLSVEQSLRWRLTGTLGSMPPADRAGDRESSATNADVIVGTKGRYGFGSEQRWIIPFIFDVGTGESEFTWQAAAGIGYAFESIDLIAAWRQVGYKFKDGANLDDLVYSGPAVALAIRW
jgi:hypothetical protein